MPEKIRLQNDSSHDSNSSIHYFKALFAFPGKGDRDQVRLDVIGHETFQDILDIISETGVYSVMS